MINTISFPGLGLNFDINAVAFPIGNFEVKWYGIIIGVGILLAMIYGMKRAKLFNITIDDLCDAIIFSLIFGIIGARLYYVLFFIDSTTNTNTYFTNPLSMLDLRNGGLAIYGGIIAAFITAFIVCKIKKISVGAMFDIAALGFLIGQAIGRWGNFINVEAYGSSTNLPWRMLVTLQDGTQSAVHPCFFYESLWCVIGFIILHIYSKHRKFNGEIFLMYITWYSFGRFFIEGLRSDSLLLGNLKVSQLVAAVLFIAAGSLLVYRRIKVKKLVEQQTAEYNPLFEETAKAVDVETAEYMAKHKIDDDSDNDGENDQPEAEEPQDKDGKKTEDDD